MSADNPQTEQQTDPLEAERQQLIGVMKALDEGQPPPVEDAPKPGPQAADQAAATTEKDAGKDGETAAPVEEKPAEAEAAGDKEAKEAARKEKTWKQIDAEKAEVRAAKQAADRARAEAERLRLEAAEKAATAGQYKPEDYAAAAKRWEAEGETELAESARAKARELQGEIEAAKQKRQRETFKAEFDEAVRQAKEDRPELNDPESPLAKTVAEVFKNRPVFTSYPAGVADAVRVAELKLKAEQVDGIQAERDKLQARIEELEKKLQPGGATVSSDKSAKTFGEMSLTEQAAVLKRAAKEADDKGDASLLFG